MVRLSEDTDTHTQTHRHQYTHTHKHRNRELESYVLLMAEVDSLECLPGDAFHQVLRNSVVYGQKQMSATPHRYAPLHDINPLFTDIHTSDHVILFCIGIG